MSLSLSFKLWLFPTNLVEFEVPLTAGTAILTLPFISCVTQGSALNLILNSLNPNGDTDSTNF